MSLPIPLLALPLVPLSRLQCQKILPYDAQCCLTCSVLRLALLIARMAILTAWGFADIAAYAEYAHNLSISLVIALTLTLRHPWGYLSLKQILGAPSWQLHTAVSPGCPQYLHYSFHGLSWRSLDQPGVHKAFSSEHLLTY